MMDNKEPTIKNIPPAVNPSVNPSPMNPPPLANPTINPSIEEYKSRFLYLDDDFLSRTIDFCIDSNSSLKTFRVQLVLFSIDTSCKYTEYNKLDKIETSLPFLKFAGIFHNSQFQFPEFTYECLPENNETQFRNQIIEQLLSSFGLSPSSSLDFDSIYRGYLLYKPTDNDTDTILFAVIDYDTLSKQVVSSNSLFWSIVDELLFEKKVLESPVDTNITNMMNMYPYMWNITYNGDYIEYFPFSLYLVISREENAYESDSLPRTKREKSATIGTKIDTYSLADEYGDRYCFTDSPLSIMDNIIRYAVFTPKPRYVIEETVGGDGQAIANQVTTNQAVTSEATTNAVTTNQVTTNQATTNDEPEKTYDNMADSDKEVLEESMSENIAHSVIYFTEKTGNLAGKHIWGIKTAELFVAV